jgi:cytochrome b561
LQLTSEIAETTHEVQQMTTHYRFSQKLVHWLMALLITLDLVVARKFGGEMELLDRLESRIDHASLNIIVMCLFLIRVYLRAKHGAPHAPTTMAIWQTTLSKVTHSAIYLLMALLFITGLATAMNATAPVPVFGALDLTLGNTEESFFLFIRQFHEISTQIIMVLISLHVVAAIYHQFFLRDQIMSRMLRSKTPVETLKTTELQTQK